MATKRLYLVLALLLGGGCTLPVEQAIDRSICSKLDLSVDLEARQPDKTPAKMTSFQSADGQQPGSTDRGQFQFVAAQEKEKAKDKEKTTKSLLDRIVVGQDIPGSRAPAITRLPLTTDAKLRDAEVDRHFPPLDELGKVLEAGPGPDERPLTLADVQKLALAYSPVLKQMAGDVEAARGGAVMARMYPNPFVGITGVSMATNGGPYVGGIIQQTIKTAGKISLAYGAAYKDVQAAELHLRQAESDLRSQVRTAFFAVLVARENLKVNRALAKLTDEVYKVMVLQLKGGEAAPFETMQLRVIANQTRIAHVQAHHMYLQLWKQLATTLGLPGMALTQLDGRLDMPIPKYEYEKILAIILNHHTDVLVAKVGLEKADKLLRLAQVTPIPDIQTSLSVIPDYTPGFGIGPYRTFAVAQAGIILPVWDQNLGAIRQAQGQQVRANEEAHRVRCDLTSRLADAFSRYEQNRQIVSMYNKDMLFDQVRAFKLVVLRYTQGPPGATQYLDLITAEQSLVSLVQNYIGSLHDMWFAVVDVASLLQTPDLFQVEDTYPVAPIPDLDQLFNLPCLHPCNPIRDPKLLKGDGSWPQYGPKDAMKKGEALPAPEMKKTRIELGAPSLSPPTESMPVSSK